MLYTYEIDIRPQSMLYISGTIARTAAIHNTPAKLNESHVLAHQPSSRDSRQMLNLAWHGPMQLHYLSQNLHTDRQTDRQRENYKEKGENPFLHMLMEWPLPKIDRPTTIRSPEHISGWNAHTPPLQNTPPKNLVAVATPPAAAVALLLLQPFPVPGPEQHQVAHRTILAAAAHNWQQHPAKTPAGSWCAKPCSSCTLSSRHAV